MAGDAHESSLAPKSPGATYPTTPDEHDMDPDLIHPVASSSVERRGLTQTLEFAFAGGGAAGFASQALERAALAASEFQPRLYESSLFIDELIEGCLRFEV